MTVRKRIRVEGRVQGVFFRDTVSREAQSRAVAGWVTNNDDGSVSAVLEGEADAVDAVVDKARTGPPDADVVSLDVTNEEPEGLDGFEVR